ncbi:MAG: alkaline phosphatase family protein [Saprospiraceae bacterium]
MNSPIEHIIVLMLENRSFDHLFGFLDHKKPFNGLTGNESNPTSKTTSNPVKVIKGTKTFINPDPGHSHADILEQLNLQNPGGLTVLNDGFYHNFSKRIVAKGGTSHPKEIMSCFDPRNSENHTKILGALAKNFVLCDNWFSSVPGETWPNRNFAHSGTSNGEVNIKKKLYGNRTIFEVVADHNLSWKIYRDGFAQSQAFHKLWFKKKKNGGFRKFSKFTEDVRKEELANYVFIEPRHMPMLSGRTNNMHPGNNQNSSDQDFKAAENLVAQVFNALRTKKTIWNKSLLVITFDEHGGFYDHVRPEKCVSPDGKVSDEGFDFKRYGIRVPTILISPHLENRNVDHTLYDHTSIIKTVLENFSIKETLTERVRNANSFLANIGKPIKKTWLKKKVKLHANDPETLTFGAVRNAPLELNDFQKDLVEMSRNIEKVMHKDEAEVERRIKKMEEDQIKIEGGEMALKSASPTSYSDIEKMSDKFSMMYED